jgi:hypothetical protein
VTLADYLAVVSAMLALGSLALARRSLQTAERLNRETTQARDVVTIASSNQRFLDWRSRGPDFDDELWCYGLWDLIATEFSFFQQGWLPLFMFRFWMNTLGTWYAEQPQAWPSHQRFLAKYSGSFTAMDDFFQGIWQATRDSGGNPVARNRRIEEFVDTWHARRALSQV